MHTMTRREASLGNEPRVFFYNFFTLKGSAKDLSEWYQWLLVFTSNHRRQLESRRDFDFWRCSILIFPRYIYVWVANFTRLSIARVMRAKDALG